MIKIFALKRLSAPSLSKQLGFVQAAQGLLNRQYQVLFPGYLIAVVRSTLLHTAWGFWAYGLVRWWHPPWSCIVDFIRGSGLQTRGVLHRAKKAAEMAPLRCVRGNLSMGHRNERMNSSVWGEDMSHP